MLNKCVLTKLETLPHNSEVSQSAVLFTYMNASSTDTARIQEMRSHFRAPLKQAAKVLIDDATPKTVTTLDISVLGLGILVSYPLRPGESCVCALDLQLEGQSRRINAWGTVVYSIAHDSGNFRAGIKFSDIDPTSRMHIQQLCRQAAH